MISQKAFQCNSKKFLNLGEEERKNISQNAVRKVTSLYNPKEIYKRKNKEIEKLLSLKSRQCAFPFIRTGKDLLPENKVSANSKLLSIVVPYYNMGAYIDETIQSILKSDYEEKEIIIINDGSTDVNSIEKAGSIQATKKYQGI